MSDAPGEFEHLVLLALLHRQSEGSTASEARSTLKRRAERSTSRGALYATLDRLEEKGWIEWIAGEDRPERGGIPARRARLTGTGIRVVRERREVLRRLSEGLLPWLAES